MYKILRSFKRPHLAVALLMTKRSLGSAFISFTNLAYRLLPPSSETPLSTLILQFCASRLHPKQWQESGLTWILLYREFPCGVYSAGSHRECCLVKTTLKLSIALSYSYCRLNRLIHLYKYYNCSNAQNTTQGFIL